MTNETMIMRISTTLFLLTVLFSAAAFAGSLLSDGEPYYEFERGEVLVKFGGKLSSWDIISLCDEISTVPVEHSEQLDFYRVRLEPKASESRAVEFFRAREGVEWANFNYIAHACYTPNDSYYPLQWHLPRMNLPQAWDLTRGSSAVVVAVCDMGYQFNHADWAGVNIVSPHDFIQNDDNPEVAVYDSHGEHVAGTIFAATNNNLGIAGIAPLCTLMPIRVLNDSGNGNMSQIASGISWAASHGAQVLNLSLAIRVTDYPPQDPGPPLSTAITAAANANVVICAATGNDYQLYVAYPAAYAPCIAVGATGYDDAIAPYSNRGTAIDVVAPGGNLDQDLNHDSYEDGILSTVRDATGDIYAFWQGTSMAAPHVSGLAALMLSYGFPSSQVRTALQQTAVDLGTSGWDDTYGYGRVNAYAALRWLNDAEPSRPALPQSLRLGAPYPNPFNSVVVIPLELAAPARVELTVYNLLGEHVATLLPNASLAAGRHTYSWNGGGAATGLYIVTLKCAGQTQTQKLLFLR
ncbi:MAG: S8 family peptidase [bacterium]|nr:S8 family peptidase [bacterium]